MGGKARQQALRSNQRRYWVRKKKRTEGVYDGSFGVEVPIGKAKLYHTRSDAEWWKGDSYKVVPVIVTVREAD